MKRSLFHILNGYAHICSPTETCHGPWNSRVVSLVWPLLISQSSTRRLAMDFYCFCRLSLNYTYLTCRNFVCQHSVMVETTLKPRAFAFIVSHFSTCIGKPGAIFSAHVNIRQTSSVVMPGFRQTVFALRRSWHSWRFDCFPGPFDIMLLSCCGAVGQGTSVCRFKSVPTLWLCRPIDACAARLIPHACLQPEYLCCCRVRYRCLAVKSIWDWSRI